MKILCYHLMRRTTKRQKGLSYSPNEQQQQQQLTTPQSEQQVKETQTR